MSAELEKTVDNSITRHSKLSFYNLSGYGTKKKLVLKQITGSFNGASLVAILGTSGSGKTFLLNILSGFRSQNATCDKLEVDGSPSSFEFLSNVSCYLTQDIHLNDLLTVRENMHYAAEFKLDGKYSQNEKNTKIEELLESFGLSSEQHTRAGSLSGGERKRLALAQEMISDPDIMFLDEPTTGLDISTSIQILSHLKNIVGKGKTVICTIHQLSANQMELFDQIYVMSDGQCAYQGRPKDMVPHLERLGLACSVYQNPADYIIDLCTGEYGPDKSSLLVDAAQNGRACSQENQGSLDSGIDDNERTTRTPSAHFGISWWKQFRVLLHREGKKMTRNLELGPIRLLSTNFQLFTAGCLFWDIGNDASKVWSNYAAMQTLVVLITLTGIYFPVICFSLEMQLVKREFHNRNYTVLQYYLVTFIFDLLICILTTSTASLLLWYMSGQPMETDRIALLLLFMNCYGCVANAIGYFFGTLGLPLVTLLIISGFSQFAILTFSGIGLLFVDMHWLTKIASRVSYMRQAVEGVSIAVFGLAQRNLVCPGEETYCFYKNPRRFLEYLELDPDHYSHCFYILFVWFVAIKTVTYFTMRYSLKL